MNWYEWQTKHHCPLFELTAEQISVAEKILNRLEIKLQEEPDWYCWEEQDYEEGRLMYENGLEHLQELPTKEKHR
jgi:hypothetical protein